MIVNVNEKVMNASLLAGLLVQVAVSLKNSGEQSANFPLKNLSGKPAQALFVLGWAVFAYSICLAGGPNKTPANSQKCLASVVGCATVVYAVFNIKKAMKAGKPPGMVKALFPVGWAIVAYALAMNNKGPLRNMGYLGAAMVVVSMMGLLPFQRKNGIVDGLGMNLFALAWVVLAACNSVLSIQK